VGKLYPRSYLIRSFDLDGERGVLEERTDDPGADRCGQVAPSEYVAQNLEAQAATKRYHLPAKAQKEENQSSNQI